MNRRRETIKKILCEGFLNYAGYTEAEIDMKKLEKVPHKRKPLRKTTRSNRTLSSMPKDKIKLSFQRRFSLRDYTKMNYGLSPMNSDEKWFILMEEPWLRFHRSWTGECFFLVYLKKADEVVFVKEAWMNPNTHFTVAYGQWFLEYLIDRLLLSKPVSFPFPEGMTDPMERALFRHDAVGSSIANDED